MRGLFKSNRSLSKQDREKTMKNSMTLLLISLITLFSVFQCSKENAVQPELQTDPYAEILEINSEIDLLDEMALSDW